MTDLQNTIAEYLEKYYSAQKLNTTIFWDEDRDDVIKMWLHMPTTQTHANKGPNIYIEPDRTLFLYWLFGSLKEVYYHSDPDYFKQLHEAINNVRPPNKQLIKDVTKYIANYEKKYENV